MINSPETRKANKKNPGFLSLFACKCPRCRQGAMFQNTNPWKLRTTMRMNQTCPVCSQPLDLEVGFYFGAGYVSYALTIALSVATFIAWWVLIGFSFHDKRFLYWLVTNALLLILLQPYLMRLARTGWLAFFVRYDRNWATNPIKPLERTNRTHENNW